MMNPQSQTRRTDRPGSRGQRWGSGLLVAAMVAVLVPLAAPGGVGTRAAAADLIAGGLADALTPLMATGVADEPVATPVVDALADDQPVAVEIPGAPGYAEDFVDLGDRALFIVDTSQALSTQQGLWGTDGTEAGTTRIDLPDGQVARLGRPAQSSGSQSTVRDGLAYFAVGDRGSLSTSPISDPDLWVSDGTQAGTERLDVNDAFDFIEIHDIASFGDRIAVYARHQVGDDDVNEVFLLDDSPEGASELGGSWLGDFPPRFAVLGDELYLGTRDGLDRIDQEGRRTRVWDLDRDSGAAAAPSRLTAAGDRVFFLAEEAGVEGVYVSDGTSEGTGRVTPDSLSVFRVPMVAAGAQVFFFAGSGSRKLWVSDGTPEGTREAWDDDLGNGYSFSSTPEEDQVIAVGDRLLFPSPGSGSTLWVTNGDPAATEPLQLDGQDIRGGGFGVSAGDQAWLLGPDSALMRTDGTSAGTVLATPDGLRVQAAVAATFYPIGVVGAVPIFNALPPDWSFGDPRELWRVDAGSPSWPQDAALQVDEVGTTSVGLSWDAAEATGEAVTGYRVLIDGEPAQRIDAPATSTLVQGLDPDTSVEVTVEAIAGFGAVSALPSIEVTTGSQVDPGTAPLTATAVPGGVSLGWEARAGADGYQVYRAEGDGELAPYDGPLDASTTSYLDQGADAQVDYRYDVRAVVDGEELTHTVEVAVTTLPLVLGDIDASSLRIEPDLAPLGVDLRVTVEADPYRTVTATIGTLEWFDADGDRFTSPQPATRELELAPGGDPSTYRGDLELEEGIAAVGDIAVELCDDAGSCISDTLADIGLEVGAEVAVDLGLDADEPSLDGGRVTLTSDSIRGSSVALPVDGEARLTRLAPSADARVRATDGSGWEVAEPLTFDLEPGTVHRPQFETVLRTSPVFEVVDEDDDPYEGAWLRLYDLDGEYLGQRRTDEQGRTTAGSAFLAEQDIDVEVSNLERRLSKVRWDQQVTIDRDQPVIRIVVPALPTAKIAGTVEYADETPAEGARVTVTQFVDGTDWTFEATADSEGAYSLTALQGERLRVTATAGEQRETTGIENLTGDLAGFDLALDRIRGGQVAVAITTEAIGEAVQGPFPTAIDPTSMGGTIVTIDGATTWRTPAWVYREGGTEVEVCADGTYIGQESACTTVTIDEDAPVTAELALTQRGGISGTISTADGEPLDRPARGVTPRWTPNLTRLTADGPERIEESRRIGSSFDIAIPEPGTYEFHGAYRGARTPVQTFEVAEGEIVDLGPLRLQEPGVFSSRSRVTSAVSEAAPGETLTFRLDLAHDGDATVTDGRVVLDVSDALGFDPAGVALDGEPLEADRIANQDGRWVVPIGAVEPGQQLGLRVRVPVDEDTDGGTTVRLGASVSGAIGDQQIEEQLGSAGVLVAGLTLEAPAVTATHDVVVAGRAPAGSAVTVFDGEVPVGVATADPGDRYRAEVVLVDRGDRFGHVLRSEVDDGDTGRQVRSGREVVRYEPGYPVPVEGSLIVITGRNASRYTFDPREGVARFPAPMFGLPQTARVEVEFDDPDRVAEATVAIGSVAVPMVRGDDGVHIADVRADFATLGAITLDYEVAPASLDIDREIAWRSDPAVVRNRLPLRLSDFDLSQDATVIAGDAVGATGATPTSPGTVEPVELTPSEDLDGSGEVEDFDDSGDSYDQGWNIASSGSVAGVGQSIDASLGLEWGEYNTVAEPIGSVPAYDLNVAWSLSSTSLSISVTGVIPESALPEGSALATAATYVQTAIAEDGLDAGSTSLAVQPGTDGGTIRPARLIRGAKVTYKAVMQGADAASTLSDLAGALSGSDRYEQLEGILDDIMSECTTPRAQDFFKERLDNIATETAVYQVGGAGLMVLGLGTSGPLGLAVGAVISEGFDAELDRRIRNLLDDMAADPECEEEEDDKEPEDPEDPEDDPPERPEPGVPPIGSPIANPYWIYDPAGYVFEAVESNRLEDATVTVLEGDPSDAPEAEIEGWTPWDAEWFGQANPLTTGQDGRYAWDVPAGWWYTVAELDGYVSISSEVLRVLPEHFDVHLGLVSRAVPQVAEVLAYDEADVVEVGFDRWMRIDRVIDRIEVVDDAGEGVTGSWQPVDAQPHSLGRADGASADLVAPEGEMLAERFAFTPDDDWSVGDEFTVTIDGSAEAYNLEVLAEDVDRSVTVVAQLEPDPDPDPDDDAPDQSTGGWPSRPDLQGPPVGFSDVDVNSTHGAAIESIAELGIALGYDDGTFRADEYVDRAEMASFLQRALELPDGDPSDFPDVEGTHAAAIGAIAREGIALGYPDGTFRPLERVSRGHMAAMLARAGSLEASRSAGFPDTVGTTHEVAIDAVAEVAVALGYDDGTFRPAEPVTRGQMASFLDRWFAHMG